MIEQQDKKAKKPRLNLTTSQVAASALAACSASIVASYLGVAGTVIGAAVGSVVATTGAAIWGHVFRTGGHKLKQTLPLLVNGEQVEMEVEQADADAASPAAVPAGRFYGGAEASTVTEALEVGLWHPKTPTAETQVISDESDEPAKTKTLASSITARIVHIKKYRKPMSIAAAIVAVFCISIVVGIFAGAPVRSAGSSSSTTVTKTTTVTDTAHTQGQASDGSSASSSSSASPNSGSTSSPSASSSSSATSSSGAGSTATSGASASQAAAATESGQALSGTTSTDSPTS